MTPSSPMQVVALAGPIAALLACGSESSSPPPADAGRLEDAGPADAPPLPEPFVPTPPAEPAAPDFGECPAGWRTIEVAGVEVCEPWPEDGLQVCGSPAEAHFPGEPGCSLVGTPCPEGDLPEGLPAGADVRHVLAGAKGGDGGPESPFGTIAEALEGAPAGTIIAIGKGTYVEALRLRGGVTLWGACVAETVLRSDDERPTEGVVHALGGDTAVRNLTIGPSARPGVTVTSAGRSVLVRDVVIEGTRYFGVAAFAEGALDAESIVIRDTHGGDRRAFTGQPVWAEGDAQVTVRRALLSSPERGARVLEGATLILEDVAIREPLQVGVDDGRCIEVSTGGRLDLHRVVAERCHDVAIFGVGIDSTIDGDVVVVRETGSDVDGAAGSGVAVQFGVVAALTRAVLIGNHGSGVAAGGATLTLSETVIHDTSPDANGYSGAGAVVFQGGRLALRGASISESSAAAVSVEDNSEAELRDVRILDTAIDLRNIGYGLNVIAASASVERVWIGGSVAAAVWVQGRLEGHDVVVEQTASNPSTGRAGNALLVGATGTDVELTRLRATGNREVSVFAYEDAVVTLHDSAIVDTLERECVATTCRDEAAGTGVGAYSGARVVLDGVLVSGSTYCGVQVAAAGELDFLAGPATTRGEISSNQFGACVQVPDYDLARLVTDVLFRDNEIDVDTEDRQVPEPDL